MEGLRQIIEKGIITDLIKAEQAVSVYKGISKYAAEINNLEQPIKSSLAYLQLLSFNEFILAISRVFDKSQKRNSTRCIEAAISFLRDNTNNIPPVKQKYQAELHMKEFGIPEYFINQINETDSSKLPAKLALYYESRLFELRDELKIIKAKRDKSLAHNEPAEIKGINVYSSESFLDFGWQFVTIIGWSFLNTVYGNKDDFILRRDSRLQGIYIERLIQSILKKNNA